jgi:predicted transcriptional regulator
MTNHIYKNGFARIPNFIVDSDLSIFQKQALIVLLRFADSNMTCYPSIAMIAKRMGVAEPTARKALKELSQMTIITIQHRSGEQGNTSNLYTIHLHNLMPNGVSDSEVGVSDSEGVVNDVEGVVNVVEGVGNDVATNNTYNNTYQQDKERERRKEFSLKEKDQDQVQVPEHLVEYIKAYTSPLTNNLPAYQVTPQDLLIFQHLHERGITPNQLAGFIRRTLQSDWWANPSVGLRYISQNITGDRRSYAH